MFESIGFFNTTQVDGESVPSKWRSVAIAKSHIECLSHGIPVLVLEDDCKTTTKYRNEVKIPDGADAIYLGTSTYGILRGRADEKGCICSDYDEEYVRVYNMLGIHAVLYLTERYRQHVVDVLSWRPPLAGCDIPIAMGMKNYNVYAVREPMFYQNDGHSESVTLAPLEPWF